MSMETIDGYVFLEEPADWSEPPKWSLAWDTEVASTLRGNEGRSALRERPRPTLEYSVRPMTTAAQARQMAALTTGLAAGRCCAPLWGRASWLAADSPAGATTISIEPSAWNWQAGDWLCVYAEDGTHETRQVAGIDAAGTGLAVAAMPGAYSVGAAVYPVFFGRPEVDDITQISGERSAVPIRLVGDEFVIHPDVPACCRVADLSDFDFAVLHFSWLPSSGEDCDFLVGITDPAVDGGVGYGSAGGLQVPPSPAVPYLTWGREANDGLYEEVLIDCQAIGAAYPAAPTFTIHMRANWFGDQSYVGDGHIQMRVSTFKGGTMHGPANHLFSNVGGQARQSLIRAFTVTRPAPGGGRYNALGTLVYTVVTKSAFLLPP